MDEVPDQLAPTVARVTHDAVVLRIRPVFAPFDHPCAPVLLVPWILVLVLAGLLAVGEGAHGAAVVIVADMVAAGGLFWYALRDVRCVELALGAHSIRCTVERNSDFSTVEVPLAELVSVELAGNTLQLTARSGKRHAIPIPQRSKATCDALGTWLERARARAAALGQPDDVPDAVRRLREREPERE